MFSVTTSPSNGKNPFSVTMTPGVIPPWWILSMMITTKRSMIWKTLEKFTPQTASTSNCLLPNTNALTHSGFHVRSKFYAKFEFPAIWTIFIDFRIVSCCVWCIDFADDKMTQFSCHKEGIFFGGTASNTSLVYCVVYIQQTHAHYIKS